EQPDDFLLDARVRAKAMRFAPVAADFRQQRFEVGEFAPRADGNEPFASEAAGDGAAGCVARANHQNRPLVCPFVTLRSEKEPTMAFHSEAIRAGYGNGTDTTANPEVGRPGDRLVPGGPGDVGDRRPLDRPDRSRLFPWKIKVRGVSKEPRCDATSSGRP